MAGKQQGVPRSPDLIDLGLVEWHHTPAEIADWPRTVRIRQVDCTAAGGFVLALEPYPPEHWTSHEPHDPTFNILFSVCAAVQDRTTGTWHAAAFVDFWNGRAMGDGSLPALFAERPDNRGVLRPGYTNWWGDVRRPWGAMSDYVPQPGDPLGLFVVAGDVRLKDSLPPLQVRERSNVVVVALTPDDEIHVGFIADGPLEPPNGPTPPTPPAPPTGDPIGLQLQHLEGLLKQLEDANARRHVELVNAIARGAAALERVVLAGSVKIFGGTGAIELRVRPPKG